MRVLAPSFGEWLAGLAEALSKRWFGLDEFGGIWLGGVPSPEAGTATDGRRLLGFWEFTTTQLTSTPFAEPVNGL
jgi:hypothetical protein